MAISTQPSGGEAAAAEPAPIGALQRKIDTLQSRIDGLHHEIEQHRVNGDYWRCPDCGEYLEGNGGCPNDCGHVGKWLAELVWRRQQQGQGGVC